MKQRLVLFFFCFSLVAFSESTDTVALRKIKIGISFSPDYCYRVLSYDASYRWLSEIRNKDEVPMFGYTTGFNIQYSYNTKIAVESGIFYSIKGERTRQMDLVWASANANYPTKTYTIYSYKYIDIPVKVNYLLTDKRIGYYITAGIAVNIFSEKITKVVGIYSDGDKVKTNSVNDLGYSKFNLSAIVGMGINYQLSQRVGLKSELVYRPFVTSLTVDKTVREYLYSVGLSVGVLYTLKKKKHSG